MKPRHGPQMVISTLQVSLFSSCIARTRPFERRSTLIDPIDERHLPPAGRIGEPEDLIASVFVQDGKILAETYAPTPTYRVVTGDGPLVLPRGLDQALIKDLERIDAEEKGE